MSYILIRDEQGDAQKIDVDSATDGADTVYRQAVSLYGKSTNAGDTPVAVNSSGYVKVYLMGGSSQIAAGSASIGKLGANSGVNIGTVSVDGTVVTSNAGTTRTVNCQKIDSAVNGTTTLVTGPGASSKLYIVGWYVRAEGGVDITFKGDGGTGDLTGPIDVVDATTINCFFGDYAIPLENNEAFQITCTSHATAAVQLSGFVLYYVV